MSRAINNARKIFLRNWLLLGVFVVTTAFIVYKMVNEILKDYSNNFTKYFFINIQENQSASLIYFILFLFLSFEFLFRMRSVHLSECCSTISGSKATIYAGQILFLSFLAFLSAAIHFLMDLITYYSGPVREAELVIHILKINILNVFLVSLYALLIGAVLGIICSRYVGYAFLILVVFITTPLTEQLIVGFGLSNPAVYKVKDFFSFMPVNTFVDNCVAGGSLQSPRWDALLFWISFLSVILLVMLFRKSLKKILSVTVSIALLCSCCFYATQYFTGPSLYDKSRRWLANPAEYHWKTPGKEKEVAFAIDAYTMDLDLTRQLSAVCTVHIDSAAPLSNYEFTLSYTYDIHSIVDADGNAFSYTREGDYVTIQNPELIPVSSFTFRYSGHNADFRSDNQMIGLPAYHPYYPFAGFKNLFSNELQTYLTDTVDPNIKTFDVSIKANVPFITNLQKQDGRYVGNSEGLTIIGGLIKGVEYDTFSTARLLFACPSYDYTDSSWLNDLPKELERLYDFFEIPAEERVSIDDKLIIPPLTTFYPCGNIFNGSCVYRDHILLLYNEHQKKVLSAALSILASQASIAEEKHDLASFFFESYLLDPHNDFFERYSDIEQEMSETIAPDWKELLVMANQLCRLIQKFGEPASSKLVYSYLCDENDTRTPQQFLEEALA